MRRLWKRLQWLRHRKQFDTDLAEELEFHRQLKQEELQAAGLPEAESRYAAQHRMGNLALAAEDARGIWLWHSLETLWQDFTYGLRGLARHRGFTFTAVLTLALGIGVNTSLFTGFNAMVFRSWDVRDPGRVAGVFTVHSTPSGETRYRGMSYPEFTTLRDQTKQMAGLVALSNGGPQMRTDPGAASRLSVNYVSGDYFQVLGIDAAWGRTFTREEDQLADPRAIAVLSHAAWISQFGSDRSIIGRTVSLNYKPFLILGVLPENFKGTDMVGPDLWAPMAAIKILQPQSRELTDADQCCMAVFGRLAPNVDRAQARDELTAIQRHAAERFNHPANEIFLTRASIIVTPERQKKIMPGLLLLFLAVSLVLLIACANVANLLLARGAARGHEIGVRLSLGASRLRIIRQLLTESLSLGLLGGAAGIGISFVLPGFVLNRLADEPLALDLQPDYRVLLYTLLISILASVACGLVPAFHTTRTDLHASMKGASAKAGRASRLRSSLLGAQVAFSLVLLACTGLMVRGLQRAAEIDPGFDTRGIVLMALDLRLLDYDAPRAQDYLRRLVDRVAALPGVTSVSTTVIAPLGNARMRTSVTVNGQEALAKSGLNNVTFNEVSLGFLETLRIPITQGRTFQPPDQGRKVAIVNQAMAQRFWPGLNPVGRTFTSDVDYEVVGVSRNAQETQLGRPAEPYYYALSHGSASSQLIIRVNDPQHPPLPELTALPTQLDPAVRPRLQLMEDSLQSQLHSARMATSISGSLGSLALLLACVGIYGVTAFAVQQRFREIGIRMALGAQRRDVVLMLLRQNLRVVAAGSVLGLAASVAAASALRDLLYGVSPLDPAAHIAMTAVLLSAALLATFLPARRAATIQPVVVLRQE
ncbi:ADOP family duplicated permease [Paludibaculum fermentans]|uniref:ABC transporter permease n=1 Tax=Paludibaculum fermentans TaxID=1473598 RepID=UPI003EBE3CEE